MLTVLGLLATVVAAATSGPSPSPAATASTVVGATVPSAITLGNSCHARDAWSLGLLLPGTATTTSTGADVCRFTWASTNDSSMLRIHQADRTGQAMQGQTTTWSAVSGSGAPVDVSGRGTLVLALTTWDAGPLYQSSDSGGSFSTIPEPGDYGRVSVVSSTDAWRAGFDGIQRSANANAATPTWTDVPAALPDACVANQDIEGIDTSTAWVLCGGDAYVTVDGGSSWTQSAGDIATNAEFIEPVDATTALSAGWGQIVRTNNSNSTWTTQMAGIPGGRWMLRVSSSPGTPGTLWAVATSGEVFRSTDTGDSWSATSALPEPLEGYRIEAIDAATALVSGKDGLVYMTSNSGGTWTRLRIPNNGVVTELAALDASHFVFGSTNGATYATTDGGATWTTAVASRDNALDTAVIDSEVFVTSDAHGRVQLTTDGGTSWDPLQTGIEPYAVRGVALHGSGNADGGQRIFAVGDMGRIARSLDGGDTWTLPASGTTQDLWDIDVRGDGTALAVGGGGTILRSTDWGATWSSVGAATARLRSVHLHPDGTALAVGDGGLVRRSTDNGATWATPASGTTVDLQDLSRSSAEVAYASGFETLVKSTDGGATWSPVVLSGIWGTSRVAAASDGTVWLFQSQVGGWDPSWAARSTDGGLTWTRPFGGHTPVTSSPVALDTGVILVPGEGGHLRATDPAPEVTDYAPGSWAGGTARFGFCVQDVGGSATPAGFGDEDDTCAIDDADPWNAVPTTPTKVAQVGSAGSGSVDLVFGMRADNSLTPSEYTAGIVVTALAPNA